MPLGLSITTKANLSAAKSTFSYSPLVLWWPPLSLLKGEKGIFLGLPMASTSLLKFPITSLTLEGRSCVRAVARFCLVITDTYSSHCAHWCRWGSCGLVRG